MWRLISKIQGKKFINWARVPKDLLYLDSTYSHFLAKTQLQFCHGLIFVSSLFRSIMSELDMGTDGVESPKKLF